ncbi:coniferyl aldehyde dehydrogenase [Marinobacter xestospongiae]|uniref:coniferyl aldehyde dehydrogenase n=1 Tax=Marinobacter xestospongiae TaxID=994319 RepID=UPI00200431AD|nr:coniferyl aldehyde dehydrogenase [Marinobacter xestospongiae]MCK7568637.1 coniferyl aldehyde dehydrogenase [Marinobacter xestospongiae]
MSTIEKLPIEQDYSYLNDRLIAQQAAFLANPMPSAQQRIESLDKLKRIIINNSDAIIYSISMDFSNRSESETLLAEIFPLLDAIEYSKARIKKWMKAQKRKVPMTVMPASVSVMYQPLGVIGIVVPWNFPLFLGLSPLVSALAAGNRAMIKMSEFAPRTADLVKDIIDREFNTDEVAVFTGEVDVSSEFTKLPFDHLVFTGATPVGKIVMRAAAEHLTPVTLELGGKSPTIIHESFPIEEAAERIAFGKGMNAGQICVSPDYILCPRHKVNAFAQAFVKAMSRNYPNLRSNEDYTAIINDRQLTRLQSYLQDAKEKGAQIITINPADETFESTRKFPMTLVLDTTADMLVEREEIFGPILPIKAYDSLDEAIQYVNHGLRPLALYYFDWDKQRSDEVLARTHSGGACINDTLSHVTVDDAPFGGIGPSGMGHYHGKEGFINFSKAKTVVRKGRINTTKFVAPPWNKPAYNLLVKLLWFKFKTLRR